MKGLFTAGAAVLFDRAPTLDEIEAALPREIVVSRRDLGAQVGWEMGGDEIVCAMRPEVNGYITIDVVPRPWPDAMGDPQSEPMLFGAWSMGHFGPFAFPGSLERAAQHVWLEAREPLQDAAATHQAFARIRSTYLIGASPDDKVIPEDYEPLAEIEAITQIALALEKVPSARCYFNSSGEALRSFEMVRDAGERARSGGPIAMDAWSNVRFFNFGDAAGWALMDTVGMAQADATDMEACFQSERHEPGEVDNFLRNISLYVIEKGPIIKDGDTTDGPSGVRWQARAFEDGMVTPPRATLRWFPIDGSEPPREMMEAAQE